MKTTVLALCLLSIPVVAETTTPDDYLYHVGIRGGASLFDEKQPVLLNADGSIDGSEGGPVLGAEIGFQTPLWDWLEFRLSIDHGWITMDDRPDSDVTWYQVDALMFLPNHYNYFLIGSHYQDFDGYDQPGYHVGVGARHALSSQWALSAELQALYGMDVETWDGKFTLALQYFWGEKAKPEPMMLDDDNDGVYNDSDACPNTPIGYSVDASGCTMYREQVVSHDVVIEFANNKSTIPTEEYEKVQFIAQLMKENPQLDIRIEGHTSLIGKAKYNLGLSQRRADAVKDVLVSHYGIDASRITATGYGETQPRISPESTKEDAAHNRRIEVHLSVTEKVY